MRRRGRVRDAAAIIAVITLSGCGTGTGVTGVAQTHPGGTGQAARRHHNRARDRPAARRHRRDRRRVARHRRRRRAPVAAGLVFSSAGATAVQRQPPAGTCHARGSGSYSLPDASCTPGALNPAVTPATIDRTICVSGWSETVRPSESVTGQEKLASMAAYGDTGPASAYEYDHLVSLELGGAVNDARNLWPEPGGSPNPKDTVEDALHRMVCAGAMPLARAQRIIATRWVAWAEAHGYRHRATPPPRSRGPGTGSSSGPNLPVADVNCSDFSTHAAAQQWFGQHGGSPANDVAGLDADHDGLACESLP